MLLRTPAELAKIAKGNPFLKGETDHKKLHVMFLDKRPTAKSVAGLDPDRSPPDAFKVSGRDIYLHFPTRGSGRSKLTIGYFEDRLDVRGTARNWRTVHDARSISPVRPTAARSRTSSRCPAAT